MPSLADFQDQFLRCLRAPPPAGVQPGLAVYRNTVVRGLIDSLRASYPTVERLVGAAWFDACAGVFAADDRPESPVLAEYGAAFPDFLRGFPPATEIPYLPDVARADRLWLEAHLAADAPALEATDLAALPQEELVDGRLTLHPAARFAWFETPTATLWRLNRPPAPETGDVEIDWRAEGLGFARPGGEVRPLTLDRAQHAMLAACAADAPLGEALAAGLAADGDADISAGLGALLAAGVFTAFVPSPPSEEPAP